MKLALTLILLSAGFSPQAATPVRPQAKRMMPEGARELMESLPPKSGWRDILPNAWGDGIRRPWMGDMRREGVKLAVFTFEFNWARKGRQLKDWTLVGKEYFRDYDRSQLITDTSLLEAIKISGLERELRGVALARAKRGVWLELPAQPTGTGYRLVELAESEWLPVQLSRFYGEYGPGTTSLMHAALLGDLAKVKRLLGQGADVNAISPGGYTPLICAVRSGVPQVVKYLLAQGAEVNASPKGRGDALLWALGEGHPKIAEILLEAGADPNSVDHDGNTALAFAIQHRYTRLTRLLRQAGAR